MLDRIFTSDANEIAQTAGVFETRRETSFPTFITQQEPTQTYQPTRLPPAPQFTEEAVNQENPSSEPEPTPVEQKAQKTEEKTQPEQNSSQKDSTDPASAKQKDTNDQ